LPSDANAYLNLPTTTPEILSPTTSLVRLKEATTYDDGPAIMGYYVDDDGRRRRRPSASSLRYVD